jgi:catechol 2,3-dioxygenase-like lactoylglutathione lyase family enzyme
MTYRMDHIALLVRNLEEEVAFLTGVLGLAEGINPMGGKAIRWIEIGDGRRFHVQQGDVSRTFVEKRTHFALSSPTFDRLLQDFNNRGVAYFDMQGTPSAVNTRPDGMRAVFLQSPTGYWFEINDWQHP